MLELVSSCSIPMLELVTSFSIPMFELVTSFSVPGLKLATSISILVLKLTTGFSVSVLELATTISIPFLKLATSFSVPVGLLEPHQVSVDEAVSFQVLHPLADILTHGHKPRLLQSSALLPQVVQQAAVIHKLSHDQQGAVLQADTVQLDQFGMAQPPGAEHTEPLSKLVLCVSLVVFILILLPYIMTLASSTKSSSYMAPSLMDLMATLCWSLHLPSFTTPNWPQPSSFMKVSSLGLISHFSEREKIRGK